MSIDDDKADDQIDEGPSIEDLKEFGEDKADDLAPCPSCGAHIYEDCERCPQCGQYIVSDQTGSNRWPVWVIVTVIVLAAAITWAVWKL